MIKFSAHGMKLMNNFGSMWNVVSLTGGCYIVQFYGEKC